MFFKAGINTEGAEVVCFARASLRKGGRGVTWCWLMRWPCGDLAWCSPSAVHWGDRVLLHGIIRRETGGWCQSWPLTAREYALEGYPSYDVNHPRWDPPGEKKGAALAPS